VKGTWRYSFPPEKIEVPDKGLLCNSSQDSLAKNYAGHSFCSRAATTAGTARFSDQNPWSIAH